MVTVVYHASRHNNDSVTYLSQDWPESLKLSEEAFDAYALSMELEDFSDAIRGLSASTHQLIAARRESIVRLRASADYLDSVWLRCRVTRSVGTSASVVGGGLTVAGGLLTLATAGAAAPLVVAGIATSSVGAATNIGSSLVERIINSKQVREMSSALTRDKELTLKIEAQLESMLSKYGESRQQDRLLDFVQDLLGSHHLVLALVQGIFEQSRRELQKHPSEPVVGDQVLVGEVSVSEMPSMSKLKSPPLLTTSKSESISLATSASASALTSGSSCVIRKSASKERLQYTSLSPEVLLETGKVVGQNGSRLIGQVIVGISAAFLLWDALDLGLTVNELIRKKGSNAGRVLRDKADELDNELRETIDKFSVHLPTD